MTSISRIRFRTGTAQVGSTLSPSIKRGTVQKLFLSSIFSKTREEIFPEGSIISLQRTKTNFPSASFIPILIISPGEDFPFILRVWRLVPSGQSVHRLNSKGSPRFHGDNLAAVELIQFTQELFPERLSPPRQKEDGETLRFQGTACFLRPPYEGVFDIVSFKSYRCSIHRIWNRRVYSPRLNDPGRGLALSPR